MVERRWGVGAKPLPHRWSLPDGTASATPPRALARAAGTSPRQPLNITRHLRRVCEDVTRRCEEFAHIDVSAVLCTFTPARNRSVYGLQARVTPMRFRDGALHRRYRGTTYQVQRYYVDRREVLYLVTFCLPRFLDQTFEEKLVTIFHELYHIGPRFDGDLRRHGGRCDIHTPSKKAYDDHMKVLVKRYLLDHPAPELFRFLHGTADELWTAHGGVTGAMVPRPKMIPVQSPAASR